MSGDVGAPPWMGGDPDVGETYVQGKDQQTARDLLNAAKTLELDSIVVRAVNGGFIVPNAVWDTVQQQRQANTGLDF